ncbi:lytic transglycosylase domain-containing protein [Salmonella enterica]|nr:lytic transglycosylase domain-containing protein [Salmonella enterica]
MLSTSAIFALAMQCAATVHPDTVHEIARVESGFNPFAIAEIIPKSERKPGDNGVISYMPKNISDALSVVRKIESRKRRYSVGLMQITSTNFRRYGMTAEQLFSPCNNLGVFEKILVDCYQRGGDLAKALSCYYSGNFVTGTRKEKDFNDTSYTERIGYKTGGYIVPGVKENSGGVRGKQNVSQMKSYVIYPATLLRGDLANIQE